MKIKHIAAIAAAMVAGTAFAQSSVTLYGVLDTGVRFSNNADGQGNNATYITGGTLSNSRFGLKGVEDLGGGLKAGFQLESGFDLGTGNQNGLETGRIFNRIAKVGLDSEYGSLYFGRQYSVLYNVIGMYEPTDYLNTAGNAPAKGAKLGLIIPTYGYTDGNRVDNNIYYSGTFGPVTAHLSYGLGGVPGNNTAGSHKAIGLTYNDGGFQFGAAFNRTVSTPAGTSITTTTTPPTTTTPYSNPNATTFNMDTVTVGAAYTLGPVKGMLGYARNKNPMFNGAPADGTNQYTYFGGLVYSVTPMLDLTAAYYRDKYNANNVVGFQDGKADTVVVIADYKLSKRTDVYASYDYTRTGAGDGLKQIYMPSASSATPSLSDVNTRSGFSVGVRHKF